MKQRIRTLSCIPITTWNECPLALIPDNCTTDYKTNKTDKTFPLFHVVISTKYHALHGLSLETTFRNLFVATMAVSLFSLFGLIEFILLLPGPTMFSIATQHIPFNKAAFLVQCSRRKNLYR